MKTVAVASSRRRENEDGDNPPLLHLQSVTLDDRTACGISITMPWWELDYMEISYEDFSTHGCRRCSIQWGKVQS